MIYNRRGPPVLDIYKWLRADLPRSHFDDLTLFEDESMLNFYQNLSTLEMMQVKNVIFLRC